MMLVLCRRCCAEACNGCARCCRGGDFSATPPWSARAKGANQRRPGVELARTLLGQVVVARCCGVACGVEACGHTIDCVYVPREYASMRETDLVYSVCASPPPPPPPPPPPFPHSQTSLCSFAIGAGGCCDTAAAAPPIADEDEEEDATALRRAAALGGGGGGGDCSSSSSICICTNRLSSNFFTTLTSLERSRC